MERERVEEERERERGGSKKKSGIGGARQSVRPSTQATTKHNCCIGGRRDSSSCRHGVIGRPAPFNAGATERERGRVSERDLESERARERARERTRERELERESERVKATERANEREGREGGRERERGKYE
jgi:hypothetical protein